MLKVSGFSLLEMLMSIALSSVVIIGCTSFYAQLQTNIMQYYQRINLQKNVDSAMIGLTKDIKRAGFIANDPSKIKMKALEINHQQNCIIIRYDSEIRHDWVYNPIYKNNSDVFTYRYRKNNLEYKTGAVNCQGANWEKLFDPTEFKVTRFVIKQRTNSIEILLAAELLNNKKINYQVTKIIKNENLF